MRLIDVIEVEVCEADWCNQGWSTCGKLVSTRFDCVWQTGEIWLGHVWQIGTMTLGYVWQIGKIYLGHVADEAAMFFVLLWVRPLVHITGVAGWVVEQARRVSEEIRKVVAHKWLQVRLLHR